MFEQAMKTVSRALFPLVLEQGNDFKSACSAFFVKNDGTFITCAHAFDTTPVDQYRYIGRLPLRNFPTLNVELLHLDRPNDVAVGKVVGVTGIGSLQLERKRPGIGASVCICGYPPFENADGSAYYDLEPYPQSTLVVGHPNITDQGVIRPGLALRENPFFGMSGGPIVNVRGKVVGLQSMVAHAKFNRGGNGRIFTVENALATPAEFLIDALGKVPRPKVKPQSNVA